MSMSINELKFNIKLRDSLSTALHIDVILKQLGYKASSVSNVGEIYQIDKDLLWKNKAVEYIAQQVENKNNSKEYYLSCKIEELQCEVDRIHNNFCDIISNVLQIKFKNKKETYCYLQFIPMNEIDFKNELIYLECKDSVREMFRSLLILETKIYIIKKFMEIIPVHYTFEYEGKNRAWMFAEFCIDAVVYNSGLNEFIPNPAYSFFYSLKINGVNVLDSFRQLFPKISLAEFLVQVYAFVRDNYDTIAEFKNYLL